MYYRIFEEYINYKWMQKLNWMILIVSCKLLGNHGHLFTQYGPIFHWIILKIFVKGKVIFSYLMLSTEGNIKSEAAKLD